MFIFMARQLPSRPGPPYGRGFTITLRHTTIVRVPLYEGSARPRDFYLTTSIIPKRQTSMPPAGFEPLAPVNEQQQTHVLDRAATGIGKCGNNDDDDDNNNNNNNNVNRHCKLRRQKRD
jgi:hypothetical protein